MIRRLTKDDLDRVVQIWLETNLKAHYFISEDYWKGNEQTVREMLAESELYLYETDNDHEIQGFIGLVDDYIGGIFVQSEAQSKGIGKQLLDYVKQMKSKLTLSVYEKNSRAIEFYQRENFKIISEGMDEENDEKEYTMVWSEVYKRLIDGTSYKKV